MVVADPFCRQHFTYGIHFFSKWKKISGLLDLFSSIPTFCTCFICLLTACIFISIGKQIFFCPLAALFVLSHI